MKISSLEYRTAERPVPGKISLRDFQKHLARYNFASQYVNDKVVLDLGCGVGFGTYLLSVKGKSKEVIGIDISKEAIDWATSHYRRPKISFLSTDASRLTFRNNTFDVVCAFEIIEHVEDYTLLLKEIYRVLKPKGTLIISTPNKKVYSPDRERPLNPYHEKEFYFREFKTALSKTFTLNSFYGQIPKKVAKTTSDKLYQKVIFLKSIILHKAYPFVPTIFIKFIKDRIYRYEPSFSMPIDEKLEVMPCDSRSYFDGSNPEIFAVMIAVCQKFV